MTITMTHEYNLATIYMDGLPHLIWKTDELVGVQTWKMRDRWAIEIVLRGGVMEAHYDSPDKFKDVISLIQETMR